jgi:hypothetical protein
MASYGHWVPEVDGNSILRWSISGAPGKAVIAFSYIFVAFYGLTWVHYPPPFTQHKNRLLRLTL